MLLTEDEIRQVVAGRPVGREWPYYGGNEDDIEKHLRRTVAALRDLLVIDLDADFEHYGSGYASYVHVFCEKKRGLSRTKIANGDQIDGIALYLSRLTPFAAYGFEQRTKTLRGGGTSSFIDSNSVYSTPPGDWTVELSFIRKTLNDLGFVLPTREQLAELLGFGVNIPTILDRKHVFDAIFYWED